MILAPGTYLSGIPDSMGDLRGYFRCPGCWFEFTTPHYTRPYIASCRPILMTCPRCNRNDEYRTGIFQIATAPRDYRRKPKVRRPDSRPDTPLFG